MQDAEYRRQVLERSAPVDLDFWRNPAGVAVPDDEIRFLLVPDAVEAAVVADVAQQVQRYQSDHRGSREAISRALIVTMGGMLPGVLLYDHLVDGRPPDTPKIEFGTVGVSLYKGPGVRHDKPEVQHGISIPVSGQTVLLVDDLGDVGGTMQFLLNYLRDSGAHKALSLMLYIKPAAKKACGADFYFGETPQDTWIITPRERVETLVKRVPLWKQRGASEQECHRRLVEVIGYPPELVNHYLPGVYSR